MSVQVFFKALATGDYEVSNSDATYTAQLAAPGVLTLPDVALTINATAFGNLPSAVGYNISIVDQNAVAIVPTSMVGNVITINVPVASIATGAMPLNSGATVVYRTGDDADSGAGRLVDWFTLTSNNPFGNTNRFTDEFGTATYTSGVVIDWATFDGTNVMGWDITHSASTHIWNAAVDNALLESIGTFTTGWRLPNFQEFAGISYSGSDRLLSYAPFSLTSNLYFHSATTYFGSTTQDIIFSNQQQVGIIASTKAAARNYKVCRVFTVTGTVLT